MLPNLSYFLAMSKRVGLDAARKVRVPSQRESLKRCSQNRKTSVKSTAVVDVLQANVQAR